MALHARSQILHFAFFNLHFAIIGAGNLQALAHLLLNYISERSSGISSWKGAAKNSALQLLQIHQDMLSADSRKGRLQKTSRFRPSCLPQHSHFTHLLSGTATALPPSQPRYEATQRKPKNSVGRRFAEDRVGFKMDQWLQRPATQTGCEDWIK